MNKTALILMAAMVMSSHSVLVAPQLVHEQDLDVNFSTCVSIAFCHQEEFSYGCVGRYHFLDQKPNEPMNPHHRWWDQDIL